MWEDYKCSQDRGTHVIIPFQVTFTRQQPLEMSMEGLWTPQACAERYNHPSHRRETSRTQVSMQALGSLSCWGWFLWIPEECTPVLILIVWRSCVISCSSLFSVYVARCCFRTNQYYVLRISGCSSNFIGRSCVKLCSFFTSSFLRKVYVTGLTRYSGGRESNRISSPTGGGQVCNYILLHRHPWSWEGKRCTPSSCHLKYDREMQVSTRFAHLHRQSSSSLANLYEIHCILHFLDNNNQIQEKTYHLVLRASYYVQRKKGIKDRRKQSEITKI